MNKAINLSGKMSILGVTKISGNVFKAMEKASQEFYLISDLRRDTEQKIANKFEAKDVFLTSSATAGILSVILAFKRKLELSGENRKVKVLLPIGHHINYGAPIKKIIEMGGAEVIGIGHANQLKVSDLEEALILNADLAFYVSSHHAVNKNHVSPKEFNDFFHKHKIPTAIDIAAEEDVWKFIKLGFDYTVLSGSKAISGPTSGMVFIDPADKKLFNYTLHNEGRAMKIGKENIVGLLEAVKEYNKKRKLTKQEKEINEWITKFNNIKGLDASLSEDKSRGIKRIMLSSTPIAISKLLDKLIKNNIYTRDYQKLQGKIELDLRQVNDDELKYVLKIMKGGKNG